MKLAEHFHDDLQPRIRLAMIVVGLLVTGLIARLVFLQIVHGNEYRTFALNHGIRTERIVAERGQIFARNGAVLVQNRPFYQIVAIPQFLTDPAQAKSAIAQLIDIKAPELNGRFAKLSRTAPYQQLVLKSPATLDEVSRLLAWRSPWEDPDNPFDLRGIDVVTRYTRSYSDGALAPHLLGYLKEIDEKELARAQQQHPGRYVPGDLIGATGLEKTWDVALRGIDGYKERLVNARGHETTPPRWLDLSWRRPVAGASLRLTLDAKLQRVAHAALADHVGAVVALEPRTGAVLAMVSHPALNLTELTSANRKAYWASLVTDEDKPLFHRAVMGAYPPGSIYKIVVAAAALTENVVTPEERIVCRGSMTVEGRRYGCWLRSGHGAVNLREAIQHSCDVFFYAMGQRLGPDRLARFAERFGLGKPTGVGLPYERGGLIPTVQWKKTKRGKPWQPGDTLSVAIGQGFDLVTPLQAATMVATIANGGYRVAPHLIARVTGGDPTTGLRVGPLARHERVVAPKIHQVVHEGLIKVVEGGTARRLQGLDLKIAGKTGTAQVVSLGAAKQSHDKHKDHAWFVAYAPYDNPKIAVAVIVEHGGHGSATAAPVAGEVIQAYLKDE